METKPILQLPITSRHIQGAISSKLNCVILSVFTDNFYEKFWEDAEKKQNEVNFKCVKTHYNCIVLLLYLGWSIKRLTQKQITKGPKNFWFKGNFEYVLGKKKFGKKEIGSKKISGKKSWVEIFSSLNNVGWEKNFG